MPLRATVELTSGVTLARPSNSEAKRRVHEPATGLGLDHTAGLHGADPAVLSCQAHGDAVTLPAPAHTRTQRRAVRRKAERQLRAGRSAPGGPTAAGTLGGEGEFRLASSSP